MAAIATVAGCGRAVLQQQHDAAALDRSAPSCGYDAGTTTVGDAAGGLTLIRVGGGGAFYEVTNGSYWPDISPTWSADCLLVSSSGHLTASLTARFAGNAPTADDHRDALFWGVTGFYPPPPGDPTLFGEGVATLSEVVGVLASSPPGADAPQFMVSGSFDLSVTVGSRTPTAIAIGFTWVRVYRNGDVLQYHVLPGGPELEHMVSVDQSVSGLSGFFRYYAPLTDAPSLGTSFDYPAWIRAHVTW